MKVVSVGAAGVSLALIALTLLPAAVDDRIFLSIGALICAVVALATIVLGWRDGPTSAAVPTVAMQPATPAVSSPAPAIATPSRPISAEAEVVAFLATLQERGRLVDFLQDDITAYSDAQVGAAARVVHQGCKAVLNEYFRIVPVRAENEGSNVTVIAGYDANEYRLVGKISGQAPFSGTLVHRGWKTESVQLPRVLRADDDRFLTLAPAEVELR
jgi:hypothetical protein